MLIKILIFLAFFGVITIVNFILMVRRMLNPICKAKDISRYLEYRDKLQTGDVIAFQGQDLASRVIRCFEKNSPYSHVGLIIRFNSLGEDRVFIIEAVPDKGVVLLPLSWKLKYCGGKAWWFGLKDQPNITAETRNGIYKYVMTQLGKSYDYKDILNIGEETIVHYFLHLPLRIISNNPNSYICSELVAGAYKQCGIDESLNISETTPADIAKLQIMQPPAEIS